MTPKFSAPKGSSLLEDTLRSPWFSAHPANVATDDVVRVFFFPEDASPTASDALDALAALADAAAQRAPLLFVSHLDAVGDRGGVVVEGAASPTGAQPPLDLDVERDVLSREVLHIRARLLHADRLTARLTRVKESLTAAKAPTRGAAAQHALDAELEREGHSLDVMLLHARARSRGFRTARGYLCALGETLLQGHAQALSVRLPPLGAPRDDAASVALDAMVRAHLESALALEDVVTAIEHGARRTQVAPKTRIEILPLDDAALALCAARDALCATPSTSPGVVTALSLCAPVTAPKPAADRLLTVERTLELLDLHSRTRGNARGHAVARHDGSALDALLSLKSQFEDRVLATADLAPASALLSRAPTSARTGLAFARNFARKAAHQTLGKNAGLVTPLVDATADSARAAISRTFGDGGDPFLVKEPFDDDTTVRRYDSDATTRTASTRGAATALASGLVTTGQRLRSNVLAEFGFVPHIAWRRYLLDRHFPALEARRAARNETASARVAMPAYDTLVDLVIEVSTREGHRPALTRFERGPEGEQPTTLAYRELAPRARAIAARLVDAGIGPGDRVVLSGDNHPDWALCAFGVFFAGATLVPLDPALSFSQAAVVLEKARASLAILDRHARTQFGALVDATAPAPAVAEGDDDVVALRARVEKVRTLDLHLATAPGTGSLGDDVLAALAARAPKADDVASILFTSGTTGTPKGVELTHRNITSLLASLGAVFDMHKGDRSLSLMPMHHTLEFSCGLMLPLTAGAHIHYLDELTADRLAFALKQGRITGMVGVPALWQLLERKVRSRVDSLDPRLKTAFNLAVSANRAVQHHFGQDLGRVLFKPLHDELGGHLRTLISGGAALPADVHAFFAGIGLHLAEGYGLTESAPVLTVAEGGPRAKPGTVGRPIPGVTIRIADADATGVGEVWAKGPNVMRGYFENDDATRATLSDDGWLRTGDLGRYHDGVLTLVGRAKDVVVTATGENIYLDDVEARLGTIAGIAEQTLLGIDDPRGGERLAFAYVAEAALDDDDAAARVKKALNKLPETFRPQVVAPVAGPLPKTASRKVKRKDVILLVEAFLAAKAKDAPAAGPALSAVRGAIAAAVGVDVRRVQASTDLRADLGFDSLLWVEVQESLEPLYGALDADALFACQTVGEVEHYLRQHVDGGANSAPTSSSARATLGRATLGRATLGRTSLGRATDDGSDTPWRIPSPFVPALRSVLSVAQRDVYRTLFETEVTGRAYIPHNRPTIVVANHTSHLDVGLVKFALGRYGQKLAPLAAKDYFFEGNALKVAVVNQLTNLVAIERESGSGIAFEQAKDAVDQGQVVLIFPEGTRRADGTLGEFRPLVGRLSLTCDVDILPLYLDGAYAALPRGAYRPRARALGVRIGPPLRAEALRALTTSLSGADAARKATEVIRDAVCALGEGDVVELTAAGVKRRRAPLDVNGVATHLAG